jgi:hypothetical protein
MRLIKFVHSFLGLIPFVWFITFLIMLFSGISYFGYVPKEGNPVDPHKLGLDWLTLFITLCSVAGFIAFFLWIVMSIAFIIFFRKKNSFNKVTTILFVIGVSGFFIFRYIFPDVFGWVLD